MFLYISILGGFDKKKRRVKYLLTTESKILNSYFIYLIQFEGFKMELLNNAFEKTAEYLNVFTKILFHIQSLYPISSFVISIVILTLYVYFTFIKQKSSKPKQKLWDIKAQMENPSVFSVVVSSVLVHLLMIPVYVLIGLVCALFKVAELLIKLFLPVYIAIYFKLKNKQYSMKF